MQNKPFVSIAIITRNRWEELQKAIESCLLQDYPNYEILVYDDCSNEDIAQKVKDRYPTVVAKRSEVNLGYIVLRNLALQEAKGKYIFSLDDDAYYLYPYTISESVDKFEQHNNLGVAALPFYEPGSDSLILKSYFSEKDNDQNINAKNVATFVGTAHALNKKAALSVGGYREFFFHQGEEQDLAIRLLERGWNTIAFNVPPLMHVPSPKRDWARLHIFGPRNSVLFYFLNVPLPTVIYQLIGNTINLLIYGIKIGQLKLKLKGVVKGYMDCIKYRNFRKPVSANTWKKYKLLSRSNDINKLKIINIQI